MKTTTFYQCDPEKNKDCSKRGCALVKTRGRKAGECSATENPKCAVLNDAGKPIVAFTVMRGDDDGTD